MATLKNPDSSTTDRPDQIVLRACAFALVFLVGLLAGEARAQDLARGSASPVVQGVVVATRLVVSTENFDDVGRPARGAERELQEISVRASNGQVAVVFQEPPYTQLKPGTFVLVIRAGKRVFVHADQPAPDVDVFALASGA